VVEDVARSSVEIDSLKRTKREDGFQVVLVLGMFFIIQIISKINLKVNYKIKPPTPKIGNSTSLFSWSK
jgi:hypothetical protein